MQLVHFITYYLKQQVHDVKVTLTLTTTMLNAVAEMRSGKMKGQLTDTSHALHKLY